MYENIESITYGTYPMIWLSKPWILILFIGALFNLIIILLNLNTSLSLSLSLASSNKKPQESVPQPTKGGQRKQEIQVAVKEAIAQAKVVEKEKPLLPESKPILNLGHFFGQAGWAIPALQGIKRSRPVTLEAEIRLTLSQPSPFRENLQQCAQLLVEHFDAPLARIWTLNPEENMLELQASAGSDTHINDTYSRIHVGELKIGLIAQKCQPLFTNAVIGNPHIHNQEWAVRERIVAFAGYPLMVEEELVGVMGIFSRQTFPTTTLKTLASVAKSLALGIQHKRAEETLAKRERYLATLLEVEHSLQAFDGSPESYTKILEQLGKASGASRVYIFEKHCDAAGNPSIGQRAEWYAAEIPPPIHNPILQNIPYNHLPVEWVNSLTQGNFVASKVAEMPHAVRAVLESQDILSILILPILVKGELFGLIGFDNCVEARNWDPSEINLLAAAAAAISLAQERRQAELETVEALSLLKKAKAELEVGFLERTAALKKANEQLQSEIAERKRAEKELEKSLSLQQATLESTADGILVIDSEGKIATFNHKFIQMWRISESLLALQDDNQMLVFVLEQLKEPQNFLRQLRQLYANLETEEYDLLELKDGRIFERYSQPQRIGDNIMGRVWSFRDVTERKQAEQALRESERRLRRQNRVLAQLAKSQTLNYGTLNAALREITEAAARTLELERVSVWLYNQERSQLRCINLYEWSLDFHSVGMEVEAAKYPSYFEALEEERTIAAYNAHTDPRTTEFSASYLSEFGIMSMLDVPIWLQGKMVGVVCHEHIRSLRRWTLEEQNFAAAIADLVALAIEASERRRQEATIRYQATHDLLTELPNRILFNEQLSQALLKARMNEGKLAVLFLDLDRFKRINDTLGHAFGDRLLQKVAERLTHCLPQETTLARWGGDEFTLLLPQIQGPDDAAKIAQTILQCLKPTLTLEGHYLHIAGSIGIALYPCDGEDPDTLLRNADAALYRAKEEGRNAYQFYTSAINSRASELLVLENHLHHALERGEFLVYYQPQINTITGQIIQMEALVRWQHPQFGLISPAVFIPLAEENGLIIPIGEWVLRTACIQNKAWQDAGLPPISMGVNLSAQQFKQPNLIDTIRRVLLETGLEPRFLELEITESVAMKNVDFSKEILLNLHQMGISIAMDDFGTGYSSLSYLKKFPLHTLKIDQSFVRDLITDPSDAAIVTAIIALAKVLNLRVVAEGVETEEHKNLLRSLRCKEMQGYFFSRPLSAEDATKLLQNPESIKAKSACNLGVSSLHFAGGNGA